MFGKEKFRKELIEKVNEQFKLLCGKLQESFDNVSHDVSCAAEGYNALAVMQNDQLEALKLIDKRMNRLEERAEGQHELIVDLRGELETLRTQVLALRCRTENQHKFIGQMGHILACVWKWIALAPHQGPRMGDDPESIWCDYMKSVGMEIPQNLRKLYFGDMHRHVGDYLKGRGIAPNDTEYKYGVRQEPFPGAEKKEEPK